MKSAGAGENSPNKPQQAEHFASLRFGLSLSGILSLIYWDQFGLDSELEQRPNQSEHGQSWYWNAITLERYI